MCRRRLSLVLQLFLVQQEDEAHRVRVVSLHKQECRLELRRGDRAGRDRGDPPAADMDVFNQFYQLAGLVVVVGGGGKRWQLGCRQARQHGAWLHGLNLFGNVAPITTPTKLTTKRTNDENKSLTTCKIPFLSSRHDHKENTQRDACLNNPKQQQLQQQQPNTNHNSQNLTHDYIYLTRNMFRLTN